MTYGAGRTRQQADNGVMGGAHALARDVFIFKEGRQK